MLQCCLRRGPRWRSPQTELFPILNTQKDTDAILEAGKNHMGHGFIMQELYGPNHTVGEEPVLCMTEDTLEGYCYVSASSQKQRRWLRRKPKNRSRTESQLTKEATNNRLPASIIDVLRAIHALLIIVSVNNQLSSQNASGWSHSGSILSSDCRSMDFHRCYLSPWRDRYYSSTSMLSSYER